MMVEKNGIRLTPAEKIANRDNWLKILVIISLVAVVVYKIIEADLTKAVSTFDFSNLLALILALFSIGLSVVFYFKATETANIFYDNTYKFTKEVSEILGRVEAGFGEKLSHLDEGYSGLKSAVERIPYDREAARDKIQQEEAEVSEAEETKNTIINDLAERAKLDQKEKENLFMKLGEQEEKLTNAHREIAEMRHKLMRSEDRRRRIPLEDLDLAYMEYLKRIIVQKTNLHLTPRRVNSEINSIVKKALLEEGLPRAFLKDITDKGIVDKNMNLTEEGINVVKSILSSI
ncbi:MAG: hypothetical protein RLO51_07675 [Thalassobaculum sp.]|uniref:hypothetical protein n=1 Tax=Thalassobaculum sp. TaxID=2022740 RepID=UPI0032EBA328